MTYYGHSFLMLLHTKDLLPLNLQSMGKSSPSIFHSHPYIHHMATLKYSQKSFHKETPETGYKYMRNSFLPEKLQGDKTKIGHQPYGRDKNLS